MRIRLLAVGVAAGLLAAVPAVPTGAHPHGNWGGAYRSVDGGRVWMDLNRRHPVGTVYDVSAPEPPRIWEATDQGLLRTLDGGQTWTRTGPRALGEVLRVVSEDPGDGSVLAGGPAGLFRAPADLGTWHRVLPAEPVSLTRDGSRVLVRTTTGWHLSTDGGATFTGGSGGLTPVNDELRTGSGDTGPGGRPVLARARLGAAEVVGTADGAFYATAGAELRAVPGSEGLMVTVAHATANGVLLGTSRGLLRFDPATADSLRPEADIPPFLAIGAMEVPVARPGELYMATSVKPYPAPVAAVAAEAAPGIGRPDAGRSDADGPDAGGDSPVLWIAVAAVLGAAVAVAGHLVRRPRRP